MVIAPLNLKKNHDAMDTDATLNLQDQEGSKHTTSSGPDINRLAGEFSSGVKFSPRVKLMMEQSRLELSAFINSLSSSAAMAENVQEAAAATSPTAVEALADSCVVAITEAICPAATPSAAGDVQTASRSVCAAGASAAGAEYAQDAAAASSPAAVEALAGSCIMAATEADCPAAAPSAAGDVQDASRSVCAVGTRASPAVTPRASSSVSSPSVAPSVGGTPVPATSSIHTAVVGSAVVGDTSATPPKNSFRISMESSGEILRGSKTPSSPIFTSEEAAQLPPSKGAVGCRSLEVSKIAPSWCEKRAPLVNDTPRIAAASFSPSMPSSRKIEDVIAFGGISEEIASPIRSSQRVRMQHNGDAMQMERATQLAKRRLHARYQIKPLFF
jgi:hypothetical protein